MLETYFDTAEYYPQNSIHRCESNLPVRKTRLHQEIYTLLVAQILSQHHQ